jgi:hypothetical protein
VTDEDKADTFLGRWSRRKVAVRRGEAPPEPPVPAPAPAPTPTPAVTPPRAEPAPELPALDTLKGLESEYEAFMHPEVDPATRTAALKKLFGDPHFNTMDRLDVYIDDYSIPDPIPTAMLKTISAARTLGLFEDDEKKQEAAAPARADAAAPGPLTAPEPAQTVEAPPPAGEAPEPVAVPRKPETA